MLLELVAEKNNEVRINAIMAFREGIMQYLEYEEDEEHETSQWLTRMKELFWRCVSNAWIGTDMSSDNHRTLNKIAVRKCAEFYLKCWKHRNEAHHNAERQ